MKLVCIINNGCNLNGIACEDIKFTWYPEDHGRYTIQRSCRIMVSENYEALINNNPDYYDSGMVMSSNSISVTFTGLVLKPATRYYICIAANYEDESTEYYSDIIKCNTGIASDDWNACWIGSTRLPMKNEFTYFHRKYLVEKQVRNAILYISAHNYFKLWLNGIRLNGEVAPAPSHIYRNKYYLTYDISDRIKQGNNDINCILFYQNCIGQNYMNGLPGILMQAYIYYEDGSIELWNSDESWELLEDTPYQSGMPCQQNRNISSVISYDFNHEAARWLKDGYSYLHWKKAELSGINTQGWILQPQFIPEGKIHERIIPKVLNDRKGHQVFDSGKIISGWVEVKLKGIKDTKVTIRYSEDLDEQGNVKHNVSNETSETYYDTFVLSDDEINIFQADFTYKAFRYFEITGYPEKIDLKDVSAISAGSDIARRGSFQTSDDMLNKIYEACLQTQINNALNQLVDCPHREQAQYVADSDLQADTLLYNFNGYPMLKKVLDDFSHVQLRDGRFPFVFPTSFENPSFRLHIPEWDLHYLILLWKLYNFSGDTDLLKRYFPIAEKVIRYSLGKINPTLGLVERQTGWHISDWPYPHVDDEKASYLTVENGLLYYNLRIAEKISLVMKASESASYYAVKAKQLREAMCTYLYHKDRKLFADSYQSECYSQAVNAACFYYEIEPEEDKEDMLNHIAEMPIDCSVVMMNSLLRVLFENGKGEQAYRMIASHSYPGWGYMIDQGYQTIWEGFSNVDSHCHAWNAYPARIMQEYICGIQATDAAFKKFSIHPFIPKELSHAEAEIVTPVGKIKSGWINKNGSITFDVTVPVNSECRFIIPVDCELLENENEEGTVLLQPGYHRMKGIMNKGPCYMEIGIYPA